MGVGEFDVVDVVVRFDDLFVVDLDDEDLWYCGFGVGDGDCV